MCASADVKAKFTDNATKVCQAGTCEKTSGSTATTCGDATTVVGCSDIKTTPVKACTFVYTKEATCVLTKGKELKKGQQECSSGKKRDTCEAILGSADKANAFTFTDKAAAKCDPIQGLTPSAGKCADVQNPSTQTCEAKMTAAVSECKFTPTVVKPTVVSPGSSTRVLSERPMYI